MLDAFICPSTFTFQFLCPVLQSGTLISMYCIHRLPSEKQHQEARIRKERKTRIFNPGHPPIHSSSSSLEPRVHHYNITAVFYLSLKLPVGGPPPRQREWWWWRHCQSSHGGFLPLTAILFTHPHWVGLLFPVRILTIRTSMKTHFI